MPWGKLGATKKPTQVIKPIRAPQPKVVAWDHSVKWLSTKARMKSPTKDAIMPRSKPFFLVGSGVMPSAAIQGLANRAGEYQTAPSNHRITAETRMATRFR